MSTTLLRETRSPSYWDSAYWNGVNATPLGREERQLLRSSTGLKADQFVVDVGCGRGTLAAIMAFWGARVLGLDFSAVAIEAARSTFEVEDLRFDVYDVNAGSGHRLIQPGSVDLITCRHVLPYLDRERFIVDVRRWLKPNTGTLHITTAVHELTPPTHAHRGLTLAEINELGDGWEYAKRYDVVDSGAIKGIVLRGPQR
ncbi:class I SAM-dependent methyltransferase [Streptomyces sp. NPDC039016]|uniref:class I SAM-dependent methyltransferase n=1 Tax=Streptomyces sp. NPDC039016 TaxID=3154330 RepID=UPI0033D79525